jgi:SAM-dependent methyltransferase
LIREFANQLLSKRLRGSSRIYRGYRRLRAWPPVGTVRLGSLRRTTPISDWFGFDRGQPIDRYYIESFLGSEATGSEVIRGRVLEVQENLYTARFGDGGNIERVDVLDITAANPNATVIADLADAPELSSDTFDCVICTQTLLYVYDVQAAVRTLHRILKPGGTALVTLPGISQICHPYGGRSMADYWRFTTLSARRLFEENFRRANVTVEPYGNVLSAAGFLYGLAAGELKSSELDIRDPDYQLIIGVKAVKNSKKR